METLFGLGRHGDAKKDDVIDEQLGLHLLGSDWYSWFKHVQIKSSNTQ